MNETRKGVLIVVSGPSGVGKSTLIDRFLRQDTQSEFSISYTTRKKRPHEEDGADYYFTDEENFRKLIEQGYFLEWENVHGNFYGTPRVEIMSILEKGKDIILDIDVKGALSIKGQCTASRLIFIEPPSVNELESRLSLRGERDIETRMKRVQEEIALKGQFGYTIMNDDLGRAYADVLLTETTSGRNYVLSGKEPILLREMLSIIAEYLQKPARFVSVPYWVAISGAWALYLVSFTKADYREKVQRLVEPRAYPHDDATRDFGYDPVDFREGVWGEVAAYLARKHDSARI